MNIFCKLGLHKWLWKEKWFPSTTAKIVTKFELWKQCFYCNKLIKIVEYDLEKEEK